MRIFIGLFFLILTFSCVSKYRRSNIQYLTPVKNIKANNEKLYQWEEYGTYFKFILQVDSNFRFVKGSYYDCTSQFRCESNGTYQIKKDSILLSFGKAKGRKENGFVDFFSDTTMTLPFLECEIKLLGLELKNEACD
ncbi:hypothetical protein WAF17_21385 [Bernardetia sp. ABR2-2B]|uniref:hypothetical protein n=1 Tax=Bernardetia sp. ABR2-2B TaxID=3127472 RepID=UPI0030CEEFD5